MPTPVRSSLIITLLAVSLAAPKTVQAQLDIRLLPDDRFVAMFSGKDIPLIPEGNQQNRRVELVRLDTGR